MKLESLVSAAKALYMAGRWDCATVSADEAARLWEALRDAAGIPEGTARAAGIAANCGAGNHVYEHGVGWDCIFCGFNPAVASPTDVKTAQQVKP